jgi:uncharacterized protein (TIGR02421 family)
MAKRTQSKRIEPQLIATISKRLRANKRVRRTLPGRGRVHIDRQLPFLIVYRRPTKRTDGGTDRLVLGEASYLVTSADRGLSPSLRELVRAVVQTLGGVFGGFLLVEVWSAEGAAGRDELTEAHVPVFRVFAPGDPALDSTVQAFETALKGGKILRASPRVERVPGRKIGPPGTSPLMTAAETRQLGAHLLGLEVGPVFRDAGSGQVYPRVLRAVHRRLSRALKRACFEYTRSQTTHLPSHYQALGRQAMVKAVWEVDEQLANISNAFDFLLYVSPANPEQAWRSFKRNKCERVPEFNYRFLPADPALLKRGLYQVPIERVEDPVIADLFSEKQLDLDRKLTMLMDRGTPRFLYGSLQVFGGASDDLIGLAEQLLGRLPRRSRNDSRGGTVDAEGFARRAREELEYFRCSYPDLKNGVEVRSDITGLMVSRGRLLVGEYTSIPASRVEALVQHEMGTHLLTYVNGRAQPLKQLYSGLAGYDELQEGLAVLAEHFVDGLSASRMRLLAARVLAVRDLVAGASFIETYRLLNRNHGFDQRTAFMITMRVYRGAGLTKDATYLRGLVRLVDYLKRGGAFEPLLVGKIAESHVPIIRELLWREVLRPPPLRPRYLDDAHFAEKLKRLREGATLYDLVKKESN